MSLEDPQPNFRPGLLFDSAVIRKWQWVGPHQLDD